ncbi:hypothetical protein V5799_025527 [Amblyomma americanum]|uniref:ISXO2-like transposase domain-containing protein n=1 Tax=Amblyomma americanum TaxID=6943 RepID=A0AAQ4E912_AMBAM
MGGPGEVVQVDECLMRGKRKANRGRLLAGDNVPPHRQSNYGGVVDRGPWVFGMIWEATKELRLFKVDRRDAATLGALIAANVPPGTTIVSDEWAAYQCVPGLLNSSSQHELESQHSQPLAVLRGPCDRRSHAEHWELMAEGPAHQKRTEAYTTADLSPTLGGFGGFPSMGARQRCHDPFLRLMKAM